MRQNILALAALLSLAPPLFAQSSKSVEGPEAHFEHALSLYDAALYGAARTAFADFRTQYAKEASTVMLEDARYFEALSAKMSNNADAVRLLDDFQHFDQHNEYRADALFHMGDFLLAKGDEKKALTWFEKADEAEVSPQNRVPLIFKRGYCYFSQGEHNLAIAQFDKIKGQEGDYLNSVKYYRAHVFYENGNLDAALKIFLDLEKDDGFHTAASYYIADIMYLQGHYAEALRYAQPLSELATGKAVEMTRIVADSHFMLGEYKQALASYKRVADLSRGKLLRADYYHVGLAYIHLDDYDNAATNLSKVTSEDDAMAQNAYYNLAACCIKLGDKKRARTAFDAASRSHFDVAIAEDAHFNKLKLAYELKFSPFDDLISSFVEFLDLYPSTVHRDETYNLIGKALVSTKNYKQALETMEKIKHKDLSLYRAMQRIAFYHALELYNNGDIDGAEDFLDYSLRYADYDPRLKARAYYWQGECLYSRKNIVEARDKFLMFINAYQAAEVPEFQTAHYNVAYTYYNKKDYPNARRWFLRYVALSGQKSEYLEADAYNRIGDCLYVERDFGGAIGYYDKAMSASAAQGDYSMLQKGICLGLQGNYAGKVDELDALISKYPKSVYVDNAYFEKARAYVAMGQIKDAIYNYKVVKEKYPKGSLASQSMLQLGLLYYNNNELDNSMAFYKRVINEYPSTPEAAEALTGLRNVYMERGDYDGYIAYTSTLGSFAHVGEQERDSLLYVSASNLYLKGNFADAKAGFTRYLETFPSGRYVTPSNFYLADCYYGDKEFDKALTLYMSVSEQPRSVFTEEALLRGGELLYKSGDYPRALTLFQRLEVEAEVEANKIEAIIGQMRCMSKQGNLEQCIASADKVIAMPQASPAILREAQYLKAKSLISAGRADDAQPILRTLSESTKTAEGAEAKYLLAQHLFEAGNTDGAEKEVFDYVEKGTPHQYWLARSFVLLADIYHAKGDDFQAVQYLQTLKESYTAADDIADMIAQRLESWNTEVTETAADKQ